MTWPQEHEHLPVFTLDVVVRDESKDVVEVRLHTAGVKGETRLVGVLWILPVHKYDDHDVVAQVTLSLQLKIDQHTCVRHDQKTSQHAYAYAKKIIIACIICVDNKHFQ